MLTCFILEELLEGHYGLPIPEVQELVLGVPSNWLYLPLHRRILELVLLGLSPHRGVLDLGLVALVL
jgi:hypothetical protein